MTQEIPISATTPAAARRTVGWWRLVGVVLFSFLVGMHFAFGLNHLKTDNGGHRWIFDFLLAAIWLAAALQAARRHLNEIRQNPS